MQSIFLIYWMRKEKRWMLLYIKGEGRMGLDFQFGLIYEDLQIMCKELEEQEKYSGLQRKLEEV